MDKETFDLMEVKPKEKGIYFVTLYQYENRLPDHPEYIRDWLEYDGENWLYEGYSNCCYVCFIKEKAKTDVKF